MAKSIDLDLKYPEFIIPAIEDQSHYVMVPAARQCFKGDTLVKTSKGYRKIKDISIGDAVLSADVKTKDVSFKKVTNKLCFAGGEKAKPMVQLKCNNFSLSMTYDHPIYTQTKDGEKEGFVPAFIFAWGRMEADQRNKLKILCEQQGKNIDKELQMYGEGEGYETCFGRYGWLRILPNNGIKGWKIFNHKNPQGGSKGIFGRYKWNGYKPLGLQQNKQLRRESRDSNKSGECRIYTQTWETDKELGREVWNTQVNGRTGQRDTEAIKEVPNKKNGNTGIVSSVRCNESRFGGYFIWEELEVSVEIGCKTYDLTIEDYSTYTVTKKNILVHNTGKTYNFVQWICKETMKLNCSSLWVDTVHVNIDKYIEKYFRPILKPVLLYCDWNAQKKILKLPNGSIDFGSSQKPENLEGFNYKRVVLNEAGHILKKPSLWHNTLKAMVKASDNQTRIIGTPKGQNLFYELYLMGLGDNKDYSSYKYTVYDSPYWTPEQIEQVRKDTPELIWKQEYMASFEAFAGMIYPDFKEELHVKPLPERKLTDTYFIALDPGWEHPTACILAKEDIEHNLWIIDEFRASYLHVGDISNQIKGLLVKNGLTEENIEMFIIDPASKGTQQTSGQSILFQLQEEGWGFVPANNDVMAGISRVTRLLRENKLFIAKGRCPQLLEEIKNYHWKEYSDGTYGMKPTPYKIGDDLVDCLKYLVLSRPDYFEHPKLNMYGQLEKEEDDEEVDINDRVDDMMSGDSII